MLTRAAPHPHVVAAAKFLLAEPDAHLYRRRYLDLITHTPRPDGTTLTDYTAADSISSLPPPDAEKHSTVRRPSTQWTRRNPGTGRKTRRIREIAISRVTIEFGHHAAAGLAERNENAHRSKWFHS